MAEDVDGDEITYQRRETTSEMMIDLKGETSGSVGEYIIRQTKVLNNMMGCDIDITMGNEARQAYYEPTAVSYINKVFLPKMYLYPLPEAELKRNVNLTQNPGW